MNNIDFRINSLSAIPYFYVATVCLGILFSFIAPETHHGYFTELGIWLLQTLIPLTFIICAHLILQRLSGFCRLGLVLQLSISGVCGVLFYMPLALSIDVIAGTQDMPIGVHQWALDLISEATGVGPPVILGWIALNLPWLAGYALNKNANTTEIDQVGETQGDKEIVESEIFGVMPTQIIALKSELHYLQVITNQTQFLELYNLRDAIKLVESAPGVKGLSPHRSWWVNLQHCQKIVGSGTNTRLILTTGLEVPVSRRKLSVVKDEVQRVIRNPITLS